MQPSPEGAAQRWLTTRASAQFATDLFAQADIDEIFDEPPADVVRVGLECLGRALEQARKARPELGATLTIPLPDSDVLDLKVPQLSDYFRDPWNYGPGEQVVGLYLTHPSLWASYEPVEEYRKHLPAGDLLPAGWVAYYRAWRPESAGRPIWSEYARTIYIRTHDTPAI